MLRARVGALLGGGMVLVLVILALSRPAGGEVAPINSQAVAVASVRPLPTVRPRPSNRPASSGPQLDPLPQLRMPYFDSHAGFWLQARGSWVAVGGFFGQHCMFDFCALAVRVRYADAATGIDVDRADPLADTARIRGESLRELKGSWRRAFPLATVEATRIDGTPAVLTTSAIAGARFVSVIRAGRLFLITASSIVGSENGEQLQAFIDGFHFMPASCWMEPCRDQGWWTDPDPLVSFDPGRAIGPWLRAGATWVGLPGPGDRAIESFWRGRCLDNLCPGYVTVTIGTKSTGPLVNDVLDGGEPVWTRASGTTLDEVAASTAKAVQATTIERVRVDGVPARHLIAAHRELIVLANHGRFIVITALDGFLVSDAKQTLEHFLAGFGVEP